MLSEAMVFPVIAKEHFTCEFGCFSFPFFSQTQTQKNPRLRNSMKMKAKNHQCAPPPKNRNKSPLSSRTTTRPLSLLALFATIFTHVSLSLSHLHLPLGCFLVENLTKSILTGEEKKLGGNEGSGEETGGEGWG